VRKADNLPPSCAVVTKSGNLNFLEPSGPVQVCNGTALPLPLSLQKATKLYSGIYCMDLNEMEARDKFYLLAAFIHPFLVSFRQAAV